VTDQPTQEWEGRRPVRRRRRHLSPVVAVGLVAATLGGVLVLGVDHGGAIVSLADSVVGHRTSSSGGGSSAIGGSGSGVQDPGSMFGGGGAAGSGSSGNVSAGNTGGSTSAATGSPSNVAGIAAKISPALVDINATYSYQSASGAGTGIVLTSDGEILTNNHVVEGATAIRVTDVGNGTTYTATVAGYDAAHDIAVLKLDNASGLTTARLGDSSAVTVGEGVVAVGNAGGTGGTPSAAGGAVTGLGQSVTASDEMTGTSETLTGMIGTNADVQPGDSGGSLVDSSGRVIGVDTAGSSGSSFGGFASQSGQSDGSSQSTAYAVPINTAMAIVRQIDTGQSSGTTHVGATAFLGVSVASGDSQYGGSATSGATIAGVVSGGAAARAGITEGDVITGLDGRTISQASDLAHIISGLHAGDTVRITWTDGAGAAHSGQVTLGSGPAA
jgi:S1-C subfamily serine protease